MTEKYSFKSLVIDYVSNYAGGYIGINFIEFYDENGDAITVLASDIESYYTSKTPENVCTNAVVTAAKTAPAHFSGTSSQRIVLNFIETLSFTSAHVWNYSYAGKTWGNSVKNFKVSTSDESQLEGVAIVGTALTGKSFVLIECILEDTVVEQSVHLNVPLGVLSGVVSSNGSFVARTVRSHLRNTGELIDETISDSETGSFSMGGALGQAHYVVILDDDDNENAIIFDLVYPV